MEKFNPKDHMMQLKGKEYLQVAWRIVWFREEHPEWSIKTELLDLDKETNTALFKAFVLDGEGKVVATGHGSESKKDFNDFIEKAETKAVGRALAIAGYGTQFAPELDEEDRIVDSPVQLNASKQEEPKQEKKPAQEKKTPKQEKKPVQEEQETVTAKKKVFDFVIRHKIDVDQLCRFYKVEKFGELTEENANHYIEYITKKGGNIDA